MIARIIKEYKRLDIAFNNVSTDSIFLFLAQQSEDTIPGVIDVDFNSIWLSRKYQIEQMLKNSGRAIANNTISHALTREIKEFILIIKKLKTFISPTPYSLTPVITEVSIYLRASGIILAIFKQRMLVARFIGRQNPQWLP